jgi:hypothetical protein
MKKLNFDLMKFDLLTLSLFYEMVVNSYAIHYLS